MFVYHFVNKKYGIDDLRKRHIKVARLDELNDPFELFGIDLADKILRQAFMDLKAKLSGKCGLLCFSCNWRNPVLWNHYAEKHQGLCLEFVVPDRFLDQVSYSFSRKHLIMETEQLLALKKLDLETVRKFLLTKYAHWRYENEVRQLVILKDMDSEKQKYFAHFSDDLKLTQVIVGAESTIKRADIDTALGDLALNVKSFKTRLAFKTFKVTRQNDQKLWVYL